MAAFSSPASANRAYYVSRTLGFANDKQITKSDMIQQVMAKYGDKPTAIGDGRLYYFYKGGKVVSVKQKYNPAHCARSPQRADQSQGSCRAERCQRPRQLRRDVQARAGQ